MGSVIDLEAQHVQDAQAVPSAYVLGPHTSSVASPLLSPPIGQNIDKEAHPVVSQDEGSTVGSGVPEKEIASENLTQAEPRNSVASNRRSDPDPEPHDTTSDSESEEPHMIGDFDGSANEFWTLYRDEAKSQDDAQISTLKEGMDSALIFAGLFSAILTAFVVDSKQNLNPSRADETVYYLQQHSVILSQISVQLASIAPQVPIPSTPPPPYPTFRPLSSDIRVNVFWFMALAFSLLAALLAILVQQWVRNYMHVFQRYGDPLKSSRLRQYLYEGCERWKMPRIAETVPGFLHVSLFLFFAGLGDSLLNINKSVALSTIVPIGVSGLLYIFTIFAPIIYPQSPYQNIFSGILWYLTQKSLGRKFKDHGDGEMKPVSGNMARGQMQLAMEETAARKDRDVRATRWLINNLTEDAEMEKFLSAIPGSFNTDWGTEVWKSACEYQEEPVARTPNDVVTHRPSSSWTIRSIITPIIHLIRKPNPRHPPTDATTPDLHPHSTTAYIQGENVLHELSTRVAHSVETCKSRGLFGNDDLWRRRARACIEATASLVFFANAKLAWFGGIPELLGEVGRFEKIQKLSSEGKDELFVLRWTCLSLLAIREILEAEDKDGINVQLWASQTIDGLAYDMLEKTGNVDALAAVQNIDEVFKKASGCLSGLYQALDKKEDLTEEVKEIIRNHESAISELEQINIEVDRLNLDVDINSDTLQYMFNLNSHQINSQFPGVFYNLDFDYRESIPFGPLVERTRDPRALPFIPSRQTLKGMCSPAPILRKIVEGQGDADAYKELMKHKSPFVNWREDEMQRQLLRLEDLRDGAGFGFTVELFFVAFLRLISTSSSQETNYELYTATFQAITTDWRKHKDSLGTQKLLLDIAISYRKEFDCRYPPYVAYEYVALLDKIFEGQTGPHIEKAKKHFESPGWYGATEFKDGMLAALTRGDLQAQSPAAS